MYKIILIHLFVCCAGVIAGEPGEWSWVLGRFRGEVSRYGFDTKGIESIDNLPAPARTPLCGNFLTVAHGCLGVAKPVPETPLMIYGDLIPERSDGLGWADRKARMIMDMQVNLD